MTLTWTKGMISAPEKEPYAIILFAPNLTCDTMQSGKCCSPGKCQRQTCTLVCQTETHDHGHYCQGLVSIAPEFSDSVLYPTTFNTLHWTIWCKASLQLLSHGYSFFMKFFVILREACRSVATDHSQCWWHFEPQHLLHCIPLYLQLEFTGSQEGPIL